MCVGEKVFQELLHPLRSFDGIADILIAFWAELTTELPPEHLAVGGDHSKGFLQVMRCRICELLQVSVCAAKRGVTLSKRFLRSHSVSDVSSDFRCPDYRTGSIPYR